MYYTLDFIINCILLFFSPMLKVHFDKFLKKLAFKLFINILLKYISSNLAKIFLNYNNLQNK